jgi:hypothetical protein
MKNRYTPRTRDVGLAERRRAAGELAIAALTFVAGEPDRFARFLASSGIGPETLRKAAREPGFLLGVLDHMASDEPLLLAFANENGIDPTEIERARSALAGATEDTGAA